MGQPPNDQTPRATGSWSGRRRSFPASTARRILRRDRECQLQHPGCTGKADVADHIIGHADAIAAGWDPADIDDESNGQAVCHPCHAIKTRQEIARGQARANARRPKRQRPREQHPGIV